MSATKSKITSSGGATAAALRGLTAFFIAAIIATSATAAVAPKVSIQSYEQLPTPLPFPYVEGDATNRVLSAQAQAAAQHKLLLIDLGGNWCADCRILSGVMLLPEVRAFVDAHYVVVTVDVGRLNRNMQIPAHYHVSVGGVPSLLIVEPNSDRLLNVGQTEALARAGRETPQALADWLARWVGS